MSQPVAQVVDLTDPSLTSLARHLRSRTPARASPAATRRASRPSTARTRSSGVDGITVRLARSLDRPLRYFLAKEAAGPVLVVADRIDAIAALARRATATRTSSTRATRAWSPPTTSRRSASSAAPTPSRPTCGRSRPSGTRCPADLDVIGRLYVSALADEIARLARARLLPTRRSASASRAASTAAPSSSSRTTSCRRLGMSPARLKAFTLTLGEGPDLAQARAFLDALDMGFFLEPVEADPASLDPFEAVRIIEDYKPLDVESATMALALLPRHPRALSRVDAPPRRRRRRREPEGLPDRGEPRAHDPERREQPHALPGGLGRRLAQALADVLGRPEPLLRAHVRAAPDVRLLGLQPVHAPARRGGGRGHPVRGPHAGQRREALRAEGRDRRAGRRRPSRA